MALRFRFVPDYTAQLEEEPRVRVARYGDGYEQRSADGINPVLGRWAVTFTKKRVDAADILAFLRMHGGLTPFDFAVPDSAWTATDSGFGVGDGTRTQFQLQRPGLSVKREGLALEGDLAQEWPVYTKPRTNLLRYSEDVSNPAWNLNSAASIVTPNAAVAPDGTYTAARVQDNSANANARFILQTVTGLAGKQVTFSVGLRRVAGTVRIALVGSVSGNQEVDVTGLLPVGAWVRVSISRTLNAGDTTVQAGIGQTTSATADFYWGGAQLESGAIATRYIRTTSAVVTEVPKYLPDASDGFTPVRSWNARPLLYRDGTLLAEPANYALSPSGLVTFTAAPAAGAVLSFTAAGEVVKRVVARSWRDSHDDYDWHSFSTEFHEVLG